MVGSCVHLSFHQIYFDKKKNNKHKIEIRMFCIQMVVFEQLCCLLLENIFTCTSHTVPLTEELTPNIFSKTLTYKRESSNGPLEIPYTQTDSCGDSHLFRAENYRNTTQNLWRPRSIQADWVTWTIDLFHSTHFHKGFSFTVMASYFCTRKKNHTFRDSSFFSMIWKL